VELYLQSPIPLRGVVLN